MDWIKEFNCAITVCDTNGIIVAMNDKSVEIFKDDGGSELIGKNLFDCHPEPSRTKLKQMVEQQTENVYTIEKNGKKKLIYQSPWYEKEIYKGFVELSLEIPFEMPHFKRT
ncbi:MAG: PAS domain-containing protein [Bacteroidota bacterium]|nr:PAS domain-containing protein [Bacteroidota bacterium]